MTASSTRTRAVASPMRLAAAVAAGAAAALALTAPAAAGRAQDYECHGQWEHKIGILRQTVWVKNPCGQQMYFEIETSASRKGCLTVPAGEKRGWRFGKAYALRNVWEVESC